jgi:hypothetical protein
MMQELARAWKLSIRSMFEGGHDRYSDIEDRLSAIVVLRDRVVHHFLTTNKSWITIDLADNVNSST